MKEEPKPLSKPRFAGRRNITLREALDALPESPMKQILVRNTERLRAVESTEDQSQPSKKIRLPRVAFINESQPKEPD